MKIPRSVFIVILLFASWWASALGRRLQAATTFPTVVLSCNTNITGYCHEYPMGGCYLNPDALGALPNGLKVGKEPDNGGLGTNRAFISFSPNSILKNTNITGVTIQFYVISTTNWPPATYVIQFHAFQGSNPDCQPLWTDAADGASYGALNPTPSHGQPNPSPSLSPAAIADLKTAMNAGQDFRIGLTADNCLLGEIGDYYYSSPPTLTVTYDCRPAAPTEVMASSGQCNQIVVSWNAVAGATGYQVSRNDGVVASTSSLSYTDASACGSHSYTVAAGNACGYGPASTSAPGYANCPPTAPTGVAASDGTFCNHVHITWNASTGASVYGITRDKQPLTSTSTTSYDDSPGDTNSHLYAVWATNSCGGSPNANSDSGYANSIPPAVGDLTASHGSPSSCVSLNWTSVPGATGYQILRSASSSSSTAAPLGGIGNAPGTIVYSDCPVPYFTTNYYWVIATNSCGSSGFSAGVFGWTSVAPATPTGLSASYGTSTTEIDVNWNAVTGAVAYVVFRNTTNNQGTALRLAVATGTSMSDASAAACTPYWYWVQATNMSGASGFSAPDVGLAGSVPSAVTSMAASDGAYSGRIAVNWSPATGATGYRVYRSSSSDFTTASLIVGLNATNYDDFQVVACARYYYWIQAMNSCAGSKAYASDFGSATPQPPASMRASDGTYSNRVALCWTAVPGATNYQVWRNLSNDSSTASLLIANSVATNFTDLGVAPFTTNYYWVKAGSSCGVSGFSTSDYGWPSVVPAVPAGLTATYGSFPDHVEVRWTTVQGADAYLVLRNASGTLSGAVAVGAMSGTNFYSDTILATCTPFWYWVVATNISGASMAGGAAVGLAGVVPDAPGGVITGPGIATNSLLISWNPVSGATAYSVWRALPQNPAARTLLSANTPGLSYEDDSAIVCTHYSYWVTATNTCTTSDFSLSADGFVPAAPAPPTNVTASAGLHTRYVEVCWSSVPGATGFTVWTNSTNDVTTAALLSGTTNLCFDDYSIPASTTNSYWVQATNSCGASDLSQPNSGYRGVPVLITLDTVPDGPMLTVDGTNFPGGLTFSWEPFSCHTLAVPTPQSGLPGTQFVWTAWSDMTLDGQVCAFSNATYTAFFSTQYYLSNAVAITGGGTVSPPSGWYAPGNRVLTAVPDSGYDFIGWMGVGTGSFTGPDNPAPISLTNGLISEIATFLYTNPCFYAVSASNTTFTAAGGTGTVAIATAGPCYWALTNSADWLTLFVLPPLCPGQDCPSQSNVLCSCGPGLVTFVVQTNPAGASRFATLEIADQTLSITQRVACVYSLGASVTNFDADAASGRFSVSVAGECPWTAVSSIGWVHTASTGTGPGTVAYTVDANPSSAARIGAITVDGQTFSISQAGLCTYMLGSAGTNIPANLFPGSFSVTTSNRCAWSAVTTNAWIHTASTGSGNGIVFYTVDFNSAASRTGTITVANQVFTIVQGTACTYVLSPSTATLGPASSSGGFTVTAAAGCAWTAQTGDTWVHTTNSGTGNGSVTYTVDANPSGSSRSATISVGGQAFQLTQGTTVVFVKATYNGLFYETAGVTEATAGFLTLNTTAKGGFTGRLYIGGGNYPLHGWFNTAGQTNLTLSRRGNGSLSVLLQLDSQDTLAGSVSDAGGAWTAPLQADRAAFSAANPCLYAGLYTFWLPGAQDPVALPGGDSFGTFRIDRTGKVSLALNLADNTRSTQTAYLAADGSFPLFVSPYHGAGLLLGWIQFPADASGNIQGEPMWLKLPAAGGFYSSGFNQTFQLSGTKYLPLAGGAAIFGSSDGTLELAGGDLPGPESISILISAKNKVSAQGDSKLRLTLNAAGGKFSGSFLPSGSTKASGFQGVIIRPNAAYGYFLGNDQSGYVRIVPASQ